MQVESIGIHGYIVGNIWMPNAECYKHISYDVLREDARTINSPMTLRDHVLRATNDGDFQSCELADAYLEITISRKEGAKIYRRTRQFPLEMFPSIKDCVKTDWQGPSSDED